MSREIRARYLDPADQIWLGCARAVGLAVERTADAFAATFPASPASPGSRGRARLTIGTAEVLDRDDCLAQMIFHELCHSLVEGESSFASPDWGLDNTSQRDHLREHACLRLQAHLADRYGLRQMLAPTTDFREYYDALPADPLADRRLPAVQLAITAARRSHHPPWGPHLEQALSATAAIARIAGELELDPGGEPSLWNLAEPAPAQHPTGLPRLASTPGRCGDCAWSYTGGRGKPVQRCRQADGTRINPTWDGCARFEPQLDCQDCGACCRAAYHSVTVPRRDPVLALHPALIEDRGHYVELRRSGDRCAALAGGRLEREDDESSAFIPFQCQIYPDRPRPCREFEAGGEHCLTARRRVGLSL